MTFFVVFLFTLSMFVANAFAQSTKDPTHDLRIKAPRGRFRLLRRRTQA
jgi:hypothetical protein